MKITFVQAVYESLAVEYLSACLKQAGHQVQLVVDPRLFAEEGGVRQGLLGRIFSHQERVLDQIAAYDPELICFSVVTDDYRWACELAGRIKQRLRAPVLFGGIHPTSVPDSVIGEEAVDLICVGEGEESLVELAQRLERGQEPLVRNIWFKGSRGVVRRSEMRPLLTELDALPFPDKELFYDQLSESRVGYALITSRGCPYHCSYCSNNYLRKLYHGQSYVRQRSVENVIAELRLARERYHTDFIEFCDDLFTHDYRWLEEFLPAYRREIELPFFCLGHPNHINDSLATMLAEAGCVEVAIGVQSMSPKIREEILLRRTAQPRITSAVRSLKQSGIFVTVENIVGLPTQGEDDLVAFIKFYLDERPDLMVYFWLRYYPRTEINEIAARLGLRSPEQLEAAARWPSAEGILTGVDTIAPPLVRLQLLQTLAYFLPAPLIHLALSRGLFRRFPPVPPLLLFYLVGLLKRRPYNIYKRRYLYRYLRSIWGSVQHWAASLRPGLSR